MEKANLFWFLDGISKNEFNRFGDFLRSPFFKIPHRIVKLYEFIESMFSLLQTEPLTKELLSEHFYPGKSFDENQLNIRKLISDFRICFEHYLTQKELEESKFEQKLFLLRQLRKAQAAGEYYKTLEEAKKLADGFETKDEDYYRMMLELIKEQYLFEGYSYKKYSDDLSFDISKQLDLYFIALKLFLIQRIEVREIALTTDEIIMPKFYENVFKEVEENLDYYKLHPDIYCRYLMLQMNKNPDRNHLHQGYISYLNYADEVLKVNCYSYYLDLLYHLQRFVNNGKTEYEKKDN